MACIAGDSWQLEPMISCPTYIGSGRSRCLPKATRVNDSCRSIPHVTTSRNGRSKRARAAHAHSSVSGHSDRSIVAGPTGRLLPQGSSMHNTPTRAIPIMIRRPSNLTPRFVMDIDKWGDGPSPIILRDMQAPLERGDSLVAS